MKTKIKNLYYKLIEGKTAIVVEAVAGLIAIYHVWAGNSILMVVAGTIVLLYTIVENFISRTMKLTDDSK